MDPPGGRGARGTCSRPAGGGAPPAAGAPAARPTEVRVGWINTVLEGKREFLYTEDGTPGGKVVRREQMQAPAGARDAMWANDPRTGKQVQHSSSEAPFYGPAKRISPGQSADLEPFKDTPGAGAAREVEGPNGKKGKLAKISGADRFRLSIGVTEVGNNDRIHLTAKEWSVPWDVTLDQKGLGTGSPFRSRNTWAGSRTSSAVKASPSARRALPVAADAGRGQDE